MIGILTDKLDDFIQKIKDIQNEYNLPEEVPNLKNKTLRYFDIDEMYLKGLEYYNECGALLKNFEEFLKINLNQKTNFTSRFKTFESFEKKWEKNSRVGQEKSFHKACNDILGYRFIVDCDSKVLIDTINSLELENVTKIDFYTNIKTNDDGYRGIHLYFWYNRRNFPLEIQIWTVRDSLLHFYTHEVIYKSENSQSQKEYSRKLREWIESVPKAPECIELNYINYLYSIFNKDKIEE
ncbi:MULTISPECIES: hypothetical protein [Bacteria]|uniref:hypothetical protein n=1 Tax=Bacteria TaxID=2 RepID=UPI003F300C82